MSKYSLRILSIQFEQLVRFILNLIITPFGGYRPVRYLRDAPKDKMSPETTEIGQNINLAWLLGAAA
jgi:hypothetical protein